MVWIRNVWLPAFPTPIPQAHVFEHIVASWRCCLEKLQNFYELQPCGKTWSWWLALRTYQNLLPVLHCFLSIDAVLSSGLPAFPWLPDRKCPSDWKVWTTSLPDIAFVKVFDHSNRKINTVGKLWGMETRGVDVLLLNWISPGKSPFFEKNKEARCLLQTSPPSHGESVS